MATTTSFVDEAQILHSELQQLIDVASPTASETQVDWGLLRRVAGHLLATSQRTDARTPNSATPPTNHHDDPEPTPKVILEAVHRIEHRLATSPPPPLSTEGSYTAAAHWGASAPPALPHQQQKTQLTSQPGGLPQREFKIIMVHVKDPDQMVGL